MSKKLKDDEEFNDFGCPNTEMRSRREEFEALHQDSGLNFYMKADAPHYAQAATRIMFMKWLAVDKAFQSAAGALDELSFVATSLVQSINASLNGDA